MKLFRLMFLIPMTVCELGLIIATGADKVTVREGSDVVLPCSLSSMENLETKLFDWKKDGDIDVFIYDSGFTYNNGFTGQDKQFEGRVSHFPRELKNGNASIKITNTRVSDSGTYTCIFPRLQPSQTFSVQLVVVGAAPEPRVTSLKETEDWSLLQCEVYGASPPQPEVEWTDSSGNIIPAEEPQVTERGGKYDVILQTTVTKTDIYSCVVTQKEINHETMANIHVFISDTGPPTRPPIMWIAVCVSLAMALMLLVAVGVILSRRMKRAQNQSEMMEYIKHERQVLSGEKLCSNWMQTPREQNQFSKEIKSLKEQNQALQEQIQALKKKTESLRKIEDKDKLLQEMQMLMDEIQSLKEHPQPYSVPVLPVVTEFSWIVEEL